MIAHIRFILWGNETSGGELDGSPFRGDDRWRNFPAGHPAAAGWLKLFRLGAGPIPESPSDASPGMASAAGAPVRENPFFLIDKRPSLKYRSYSLYSIIKMV